MLVLSRQLIENKYIINNYLCYLEGNHISVSHFKNNNTFLVFNEIWSAILKCNFSQPPREKQKQKFTPSPEEGLTDNQTSLMTQQTEVGGRTPTNGLLLRHIQSSLQELRPHKKGQKILQHPCSIPPPSRTQNLNSETSKKKKNHTGFPLWDTTPLPTPLLIYVHSALGRTIKNKYPGSSLWCGGLRIMALQWQHCQCSSPGRCCGTGSIPGPGTFICHGDAKQNKTKQKQKNHVQKVDGTHHILGKTVPQK